MLPPIRATRADDFVEFADFKPCFYVYTNRASLFLTICIYELLHNPHLFYALVFVIALYAFFF